MDSLLGDDLQDCQKHCANDKEYNEACELLDEGQPEFVVSRVLKLSHCGDKGNYHEYPDHTKIISTILKGWSHFNKLTFSRLPIQDGEYRYQNLAQNDIMMGQEFHNSLSWGQNEIDASYSEESPYPWICAQVDFLIDISNADKHGHDPAKNQSGCSKWFLIFLWHQILPRDRLLGRTHDFGGCGQIDAGGRAKGVYVEELHEGEGVL